MGDLDYLATLFNGMWLGVFIFYFFQLSGTQTPEMRKNVVEKRRNGCRAAMLRMTLQGCIWNRVRSYVCKMFCNMK